MKITTRQVIQHFLTVLLEQLQKQKTGDLDSFFKDFFTKEEIIEMVKIKYGSSSKGHLKVMKYGNEQLTAFLSNADILSYYLTAWKTEIQASKAITPVEVYRTLEQLGLYTHYLMSKAIKDWDEYDFSNYRSLSGKAGKVCTIYGIYDAEINCENVEQVDTHPKRFYETREKAKIAMKGLITDGKFKKEELQVLPRLVGDA